MLLVLIRGLEIGRVLMIVGSDGGGGGDECGVIMTVINSSV